MLSNSIIVLHFYLFAFLFLIPYYCHVDYYPLVTFVFDMIPSLIVQKLVRSSTLFRTTFHYCDFLSQPFVLLNCTIYYEMTFSSWCITNYGELHLFVFIIPIQFIVYLIQLQKHGFKLYLVYFICWWHLIMQFLIKFILVDYDLNLEL